MDYRGGVVMLGTGHMISLSRHPRWYILMLKKVNEDGRTVYLLVAHRDDGFRYLVTRIQDKLDVSDVVGMLDDLVEMIRKRDRADIVQLMYGTGLLNVHYEKTVWV
jgi:hypothetical protein